MTQGHVFTTELAEDERALVNVDVRGSLGVGTLHRR